MLFGWEGQLMVEWLEISWESQEFELKKSGFLGHVIWILFNDFAEEVTDFVGAVHVAFFRVLEKPIDKFLDKSLFDT